MYRDMVTENKKSAWIYIEGREKKRNKQGEERREAEKEKREGEKQSERERKRQGEGDRIDAFKEKMKTDKQSEADQATTIRHLTEGIQLCENRSCSKFGTNAPNFPSELREVST